MPVEPYQVTTIQRRPVTASDKPRTVADYQADLIRRFGRLPSHEELAKRENAARRYASNRQAPASIKQPAAMPPAPTPTRVVDFKRTRAEALRYRAERMNAAAQKRILGFLNQQRTITELSRMVNMSRSGVDQQLKALMADGLVKRGFTDGAYVWWAVARKQEQGAE